MNIILTAMFFFFFGSVFGFVVCFIILENLGGKR